MRQFSARGRRVNQPAWRYGAGKTTPVRSTRTRSGGMIHVRAGVGRTNRQEELNDTTLGYPSLLTSVFVIRKELETLRLL
jgi:hypothetical protein